MTDPSSDHLDPRRVRLGLAIVVGVVVIALVMAVVVDAPAGRALMIVIAATAIVRAFMLVRWIRRTQGG
jgi:hypothetical protein